ncbi:MAG: hypothetical protein IPG23_24830 [Burkholderiales bacterium]|nr:hypothetical protein [Burkholderiales bacterium]
MTGRTAGRPELEFRLAGLIDSISFGADGTPLAGLLLASSNLKQRAVVDGVADTPHTSSVWMLELQSRRVLQVASGGTRGESIVTTADGRILVAQTGRIDEIAVRPAPTITATTVPDGSLVPLPLNQIGVVFDQTMWLGDAADTGSILNPANFTLTLLDGGTEAASTLTPQSIRWDAATRTAWLDVAGLPAGRYQLDISSQLRNSTDTRLEHGYLSTFTALLDMTSLIRVDFSNTRADRATGQVSYDVSLTNIGTDDLRGPLTLLLDPGRYFAGSIAGAHRTADPATTWALDLTARTAGHGGQLRRRRHAGQPDRDRHPGQQFCDTGRHGRPGQVQPRPEHLRRPARQPAAGPDGRRPGRRGYARCRHRRCSLERPDRSHRPRRHQVLLATAASPAGVT